ncbi:hypothetical protein FQR65_LT07599 [Abscondita terminalis]|nr:hypothetical protein FQR65_LT07599 [Abscondita terminalis]
MKGTTMSCQICLKEIREGTLLHSLSNELKLSTLPIKTDLTNDEHPHACNECKPKLDDEHQTFTQNENILTTENLSQSITTNFPSLVGEENFLKTIKDEFVEVAVENENIVKEEYVLFNMDMSMCVEKSDILYYCQQCSYATSDKPKLTDHVFTHQYKCNLCNYTTFDHSSLKEHKKVHILYYGVLCLGITE